MQIELTLLIDFELEVVMPLVSNLLIPSYRDIPDGRITLVHSFFGSLLGRLEEVYMMRRTIYYLRGRFHPVLWGHDILDDMEYRSYHKRPIYYELRFLNEYKHYRNDFPLLVFAFL